MKTRFYTIAFSTIILLSAFSVKGFLPNIRQEQTYINAHRCQESILRGQLQKIHRQMVS